MTKLKYKLWSRETSVIYEIAMNTHTINKRKTRHTAEESRKSRQQVTEAYVAKGHSDREACYQGWKCVEITQPWFTRAPGAVPQATGSWGDGLVGKGLAMQVCRHEFGSSDAI